MSAEKTPGRINSLVKPIVDITTTVAIVLAYLQAIFKLVDTEYPNTTSLLTIVITSIVVVTWRWQQLGQKKKKPSSKLNSKHLAKKSSALEHILDPIKASKPDPYILPLIRRRVEIVIIVLVITLTLGWFWVNATDVLAEFSQNASLTCSDSTIAQDRLMIIVADMSTTDSAPSLLISDKIYQELLNHQEDGNYDLCRLSETIEVSTIANEKAKEHAADLVIWGQIDVIYQIHLEAPALANPHRTLSELSSAEAASVEFQFNEPTHISYTAQFALSEILFMSGNTRKAQINLLNLLQSAEQDGMRESSPNALADGYFLSGLLHDPGYSDMPSVEQALGAYHLAAELNSALYAASFNRGLILMYENMVDEAIVEFTHVIESNTNPLQASALVNRANLLDDPAARLRDLNFAIQLDPGEGYFFRGVERMNQEDYDGAIDDFNKAVDADPQGYYNYHLLGQAQLYAGKIEAALDTYKRIIPTLNDETRTQVITELQEAAKHTPEITLAVKEIIASLQQAELP